MSKAKIVKMKNMLRSVTAFMAILILSSCEHKELCYSHAHTAKLQVIFDWKNASEANPETMRLYLFPIDGGKAEMYEFVGKEGGYIQAPVGKYRAVCINSDTESILYRNIDRFDKFEAFSPSGALILGSFSVPRVEGTSDERVAKSPDRLYSGRHDDITIEQKEDVQVMTFYPEPSVCRYRVTVLNVSNLKYISSDGVSGALSGMSGGLLLGGNELTKERVTVPFSVVSDGISTLTADFLVFGQTGSDGPPHKLVIYVIMADGSKNYYTFNVTDQVDNAADPRDVHIVLDGLPLPKPIVNGGGFKPSVDEWQNVEVDVPM